MSFFWSENFILLFLCKCAPLHFLSYLSFNLKYFKSDSASPLSLIIGSERISCLNLPFSPLNLFIFGNYVFIFISESHFSLFFFHSLLLLIYDVILSQIRKVEGFFKSFFFCSCSSLKHFCFLSVSFYFCLICSFYSC